MGREGLLQGARRLLRRQRQKRSRRPTASWLPRLHPDKNPDPAPSGSRRSPRRTACCRTRPRRKEYDETRRLFANGGFGRGRFSGGGGNFGGFGGDGAEFNLNDLFDAAGQTGGANIGDLFGGLFGRGAQQPRPSRPRRGNDLETETELVLHGGHQGCGDAAAADQPGAVHQLPRQRRAAGHQPEGVPELQRRRASSAATRARSGSPSRAPSAGAAARSSSTRATSAKAPASPPAPAPSTCGSRRASRTASGSGSPDRARPGCAVRRPATCT